MIHSGWAGGVLAIVSLVAAGTFMVTVLVRRGDVAAGLAHAAMALGMAGMFAPSGNPVPAPAGAVVFAVIGAWFGARWLRGSERADGDALHLVVGPLAMIVMYVGMGDAAAAPEAEGSGHAGHGSALASGGGNPVLAGLLLVLTAYFVWHTWAMAAGAARPAPGRWSATRVGHVTMSAVMALMLFDGL